MPRPAQLAFYSKPKPIFKHSGKSAQKQIPVLLLNPSLAMDFLLWYFLKCLLNPA